LTGFDPRRRPSRFKRRNRPKRRSLSDRAQVATEGKGVSAQVGQKLSRRGRKGEGRKEGGVAAASRALGITRQGAQRAIKVASIVPEAKEAAKAAGIANNQSALLKVAEAPAEKQVEAVKAIVEAKSEPKPEPKPVAAKVEAKPKPDVAVDPLERVSFRSDLSSPGDHSPKRLAIINRLTRYVRQNHIDSRRYPSCTIHAGEF
jgi:hypothetical protein